MSANAPNQTDESAEASRAPTSDNDRADLRRGVIVNSLGYIPKLAIPVLLVLVVRAYGAEAFGLFTFAQAVLLFVCRVLLVGMDKGVLWWTPQQSIESRLSGFNETFSIALLLSLVATLVIAFVLAPLFASWGNTPEATLPLRIMAFSLIPMVLTELLLASTMGLKKMEPNVVVKETLLPVITVGGALALAPFQIGALGLASAFVAGYLVTCLFAYRWWSRLFSEHKLQLRLTLPPKRFIQYCVPMWLSEMSNSFLQRMDTYFITAFLDLRALGIYAAVVQIANAIRSIRRSFDPIVIAITSEIGAKDATERLRDTYSYATYLVTATQLPALVFVIVFANWLMPLFGTGFEEGIPAVVLLCAFWVFNSPFSLAGNVVSAYGYSGLVLFHTVAGIAAQSVLLWWLVPKYNLFGAAMAVGLGYTVVSGIQLIQMRLVTQQWNYQWRVLIPAALGGICGALGYLTFMLGADTLGHRTLSFTVFIVLYAMGLLGHKRLKQGRASTP